MNGFANDERTNNLHMPGFMKALTESQRDAIALISPASNLVSSRDGSFSWRRREGVRMRRSVTSGLARSDDGRPQRFGSRRGRGPSSESLHSTKAAVSSFPIKSSARFKCHGASAANDFISSANAVGGLK